MMWMRSKIDGIQSLLTAKVAEEAGLDFLSFVFDRQREDYIDPGHARIIRGQLQVPRVVGIFADADIGSINSIAEQVHLDYVELWGHEPATFAQKLDLPIIRRYVYDDNFSIARANAYPAEMLSLNVDAVLQEPVRKRQEIYAKMARDVSGLRKSFFLSGNIQIQHLHELERALHPYGVCVSSRELMGEPESLDAMKSFLKKLR